MKNGKAGLSFGLILLPVALGFSQDSFVRGTDLTKPRIVQSGATIWHNNQAYRHCRITDVSADQNTVSISSPAGEFNVEWLKLPENTRLALSSQYQDVIRKKQDEEDRKKGIVRLSFLRVFSVSTMGPLINFGETVCVITGLPSDKQYANGDEIRSIRVQVSSQTYTYQSQGSGMVAARIMNYVGE